jgi:hypothetical protein
LDEGLNADTIADNAINSWHVFLLPSG